MNLIKDSKLQKNGNSLPCGDAEESMNFSESKPEKPFSDNTGAHEDSWPLSKKHPRPSIQGDLQRMRKLQFLKISKATRSI